MTDSADKQSLDEFDLYAGLVLALVALLGPGIARLLGENFQFLVSDSWRLIIGSFGLIILTESLGRRAQRVWREDGGWSPRVLGYAAGAISAVIALLVILAISSLQRVAS